jgi:general secretion pathway protein C
MNKLPKLITFMLAGAVCAVLAFWWVRLREVSPPVVAIASPDRPAHFDLAVQTRLFGTRPQVTMSAPSVDIVLGGVIAPGSKKGRGVAVLAVDAKPMRAYRTGDEIAPGIQLVEVQATRVLIEQNGARSEVSLPPTKFPSAPGNR